MENYCPGMFINNYSKFNGGLTMEITEVRLTLRDEPKLKAFANVTFDDAFVVRGIKIIEGDKGLFVAMPSKKGKDGVYRDIAHPVTNDMRKRIENAVLAKYEKALAGVESAPPEESSEKEEVKEEE